MLDDASNGKLDIVITKSISRFGRNTEDTLIGLRKLKEKNVQVIFDQENIDTYNYSSELLITILAEYAQEENESRRQNQLWAIRKRVEDGTSELYMRKCYGYKKDSEGRLIIKSSEAEVVQMIYSSYLDGMSIIGIQKKLKELNIPTSTGKEVWSKKAIENILTNEKYTGDVVVLKTKTSPEKGHKRVKNTDSNKYMIQDFIPSIITKEIFDKVQAERKNRTNIETDGSGTHRKETKYSSKK